MGSTSQARRAAATAVALGITLVLAAVGCVQPSSPVGRYRITGIYTVDGDIRLEPLLPGTTITLELTADGKVSGQACNSYGGSWTAVARGFRISNLYSTDMACSEPEGVMQQEYRFLDKLGDVGTIVRRGGSVTFGSAGEPSYQIFEAQRL